MATIEISPGQALEGGRRKVGVTQERLAELYRSAAGGEGVSNKTIESWLRGKTEPKVSQYNVLALIINEHFERLDLPDRLPYVRFVEDDDPPTGAGGSLLTFSLPNGSIFYMSYSGDVRDLVSCEHIKWAFIPVRSRSRELLPTRLRCSARVLA